MTVSLLMRIIVAAIAVTILFSTYGRAADHVVEIRELEFVPAEIDARAGDTVTWINLDIVPHTATAIDRGWDTGPIGPQQRKTLTLPSSFARRYHCVFHPGMLGNL